MASLFHWISRVTRRAPWPTKSFSNPRYEVLPASLKIEEETLPDYLPQRFYPVRIGQVFDSRYQATSVFVRTASIGTLADHERDVYQRVNDGPQNHPGRDAVRSLLDVFKLTGPDGEHQCLVHPPLWESIRTFLTRNPIGRLPNPVFGIVLQRLFQALDYLHTECGIIHTDIKSDNIMFGFQENSALIAFEQAELDNPSPRKEVDGRVIYISRQIPKPKRLGPPVLCDFGAAFFGDKLHDDDVQPDQYRCPEVILEVPWSYKIDVWSVGCMVWDIFEGGVLFRGKDPELGVYRGRAHLAEVIALLGPPPPEFLNRGKLRSKFFSESGEWQAGIEPLPSVSLEKLETNLEGTEKELFLQLMGKMLRWAPEDRKTPRELLEDPWLAKSLRG